MYQKIVSLTGTRKDDTPMVRRAAAKNISAVFAVFEDEYIGLFVAQYDEFMRSDDVRLSLATHGRRRSSSRC